MQTHPKKRIEDIIEAPLMRRVMRCLDHGEVSGYSVMSITAGRGRGGSWSADDQVGEAGQMVALVCITDASKVDEILDLIFAVVSHQIGLITVSDVAVVRPERF
jgi:hypothetical protein